MNAAQKNQADLWKSFFLYPERRLPLVAVGWSLIYELWFYLVFAVLLLANERVRPLALGMAVSSVHFLGDRAFFVGTEENVAVAGIDGEISPTAVHGGAILCAASDGKRVVMFPRSAAEVAGGSLHATFLLNFFDELRRRVPVGK